MQIVSLIWGILALIAMVIALFPCFGAFNWLNIPFSGIGLILSIISLFTTSDTSKLKSVLGGFFCLIAIGVGILRLVLGFGVL